MADAVPHPEAVASYIESNNLAESFLGSSAEQNEVEKWLALSRQIAQNVNSQTTEAKHFGSLGQLHRHLLPRMFLVSDNLTVADVAVSLTLAPVMMKLDAATQFRFSATTRWFDFIQHHPVVRSTGVPLVELDLNFPLNPKPPRKEEKLAEKDQKTGQPSDKATQEIKSRKSKQPKGQPPGKTAPAVPDIVRLDIRVGQIKSVKKHPSADSLYLEEIDLGEEKVRQVVSGLVAFVPIEQMQDARVICLCNLKPAKMRGIESQAMVLCASSTDHTAVELIQPPEGAKIGEKIFFEGYEGEPDKELNPKKKIFESLKPDLFINASLVATYRDKQQKELAFLTSAGPCKAKSLVGGSIG